MCVTEKISHSIRTSQQPLEGGATMGGFSGDQSLTPSMDSGQARLKELGYKQELKRDLSSVSISFTSFLLS